MLLKKNQEVTVRRLHRESVQGSYVDILIREGTSIA